MNLGPVLVNLVDSLAPMLGKQIRLRQDTVWHTGDCRTGTEKGMECCDGRGQRSIDDVSECGGPKEKLAISSFLCFPSINI